ncbi:desi2 [Symbiodinium sp. CCMP2592]|nr:desi2 [Symbiodinium sp. CCMP2592]
MAAKRARLDNVLCGGDEQAAVEADDHKPEGQDEPGGGVDMSDVDEEMDDGGGDDAGEQTAPENPFGGTSDEAAITRACRDLRCPDFYLIAYPSVDDNLQCQWSTKQLTKLLCPGDVPDDKLRKFWNKNEKVILDSHAEIWHRADRDEDADIIRISASPTRRSRILGSYREAVESGTSDSQVCCPVVAQMPAFHDDCLDEITTEAPDKTRTKTASGKQARLSLSMTRRFEIVKMVRDGKKFTLAAALDHFRVPSVSICWLAFWDMDYDWSTLQRAFSGIKQAWYATQQLVPDTVLSVPRWHKESWLSKASSASSCCTGAGTAEMSRAVLEMIVNASGAVDMQISTVATWATTAWVPQADNVRRAEGPTNAVFLAHGRMHGELQTPLLLLENVQGLDMQMVQQTHPDYEWYQIFTEPGELGFAATSRARTYVIGAHKYKTVCLHDPFELHDAIKNRMAEYAQTTVSDYLVATEQEIIMEAQDTGRTRKVVHRPGVQDYSYYLTQRELHSKAVLDNKYRQRFNSEPETNPNLVYNLGDNAEWNTSWSACSGALPTFRLGSSTAKFWLPKYRRWLTCREKLVAMGFPVTTECAEALGTPIVFVSDVRRAADILGNCMHFTTAGVMQLIALSCFGPAELEPWGPSPVQARVTWTVGFVAPMSPLSDFFNTWPDGTRMDDDNVSMRSEVAPPAATSKARRSNSAAQLEGEPSEPKRRRASALRPSTAAPAGGGAAPAAAPNPSPVVGAQQQPALWRLVADSTLREYMEAAEPVKAGRSFTNKMGSKVVRLAFYGMFRKLPTDATDSGDKRTQITQLKNEYLRLGQPMQDCTLLDLVRRVEIEFSKNKVFEVGRGARSWEGFKF